MGSHDFIKFPPVLDRLSPATWMLLGNVEGIVNSMHGTPMLPFDSADLQRMYLAKGIHGTTAIEGNRLTESEVDRFVRGDDSLGPKDPEQVRQLISALAAYSAVTLDSATAARPSFSIDLLHKYHALLLDGLEHEGARAGQFRFHNVTVGRYLAPPPDDLEFLVERFCEWLNTGEIVPESFEGGDIAWHFLRAIVAQVYFAWIHPYGDGNGRLARLIEYALLLRAGVPASVAHIPSYCYSRTREQYYRELQQSHGDFIDGRYQRAEFGDFIAYALEEIEDELYNHLLEIQSGQVQVIWRDCIRVCFPDNLTTAQQRRLRLAIDLTDRCADMSLHLAEIWDFLDFVPAGNFEYSDIMLERDLSALTEMGLLTQDDYGFRPNVEIMRSLFSLTGFDTD